MTGKRENRVALFLSELKELCKKYDVSISHEDTHGSFIIVDHEDYYDEWMDKALDQTGPEL